ERPPRARHAAADAAAQGERQAAQDPDRGAGRRSEAAGRRRREPLSAHASTLALPAVLRTAAGVARTPDRRRARSAGDRPHSRAGAATVVPVPGQPRAWRLRAQLLLEGGPQISVMSTPWYPDLTPAQARARWWARFSRSRARRSDRTPLRW